MNWIVEHLAPSAKESGKYHPKSLCTLKTCTFFLEFDIDVRNLAQWHPTVNS